MVELLRSYICGSWETPSTGGYTSLDPVSGEPIAEVSSSGFDFEHIRAHGKKNSSSLRNLTFHERAHRITALAKYLNERKKNYYPVSIRSGSTLADSKIDIDGGINTLFALSSLARRSLPNEKIAYEAGSEQLSRGGTFLGKHLLVPKHGLAVLINAFNFPCWGMLEKLGNAFIAGMPVLIKPASVTSYVATAMARDIIASQILPEGSFQIVNGHLGNIFELLDEQDVVSFTGSANTALNLRSHPNILERNIPFYIESDSLNFALLSQEARVDDEEFNACVAEIIKELSTKSGQRCTCIRRIFVPEHLQKVLQNRLIQELEKITLGDPQNPETQMGPLVSREQKAAVKQATKNLLSDAEILFGHQSDFSILADIKNKDSSAFYQPTLLLDEHAAVNPSKTHEIEAFGPVATVIPYASLEQAIAGIRRGRGSLVGSLYSNHIPEIREIVAEVGSWHGRLNLINGRAVAENPGHGTVMPHMIHGGPGRSGGSEELGGARGVKHFLQRVGLQGDSKLVSQVSGDWIEANEHRDTQQHPFRLFFEELTIGEGITTHKRTITEADIVNFGCLSWDHFYAHFDQEAAERSIFGKRVVHGYFLLSAAAGLFVDPGEGPVIANTGLDDLRFFEPVYAGDTIHVRLTCKEKTLKTQKDQKIPPCGEVKWGVTVYNQERVPVARYTVLTLVKQRSS